MKAKIPFLLCTVMLLFALLPAAVAQEYSDETSGTELCTDGDCLLCCLNRPADDPFVLKLIDYYGLNDVGYAFSSEGILGLSNCEMSICGITIYPGFSGTLPMGITADMTKADIEKLLGAPTSSWATGYRTVVQGTLQVTVVYQNKKCNKLEYMQVEPLEGYEPANLCFENGVLPFEGDASAMQDNCATNDKGCLLCYLTRKYDEEETKVLIERYGMKEAIFSSMMDNMDKGIELYSTNGIITLTLTPEKFNEPLPLIGSGNTSRDNLMIRYPEGDATKSQYFKFIYLNMIEVSIYYRNDYDTITTVDYKPLPFIKFNNTCFDQGLESQVVANKEAIWKLFLLYDIKSLFSLCESDIAAAAAQQVGTFGHGSVRDDVYVVKMYSGLTKEEADERLDDISGVIENVKFGMDIMFTSSETVEIGSGLKQTIQELAGVPAIEASEFSFSSTVMLYQQRYSDYKDNSINLLITPASGGGYDLLLVLLR